MNDLARYVDYTLLRPDATAPEIDALCATAAEELFCAVCVNGIWVERARERLVGTGVAIATVVAFPLGANPVAVKVAEARTLVQRGADELDMVVSLGHLRAGDERYVTNEIRAVVDVADGRTVKCILETAALESGRIELGAEAARAAGAQFVKTSTGMHPNGGATEEVVRLLAASVGPDMGIKASGGIRTAAAARAMIAAGATRIGTSANLSV